MPSEVYLPRIGNSSSLAFRLKVGLSHFQKAMKMKYLLELQPEHTRPLIEALDLFARIHMGQIESMAEAIRFESLTPPEKIEKIRELCKEIKGTFGHPPNGSYGIYHQKVPQSAKVAWDLQCVLR